MPSYAFYFCVGTTLTALASLLHSLRHVKNPTIRPWLTTFPLVGVTLEAGQWLIFLKDEASFETCAVESFYWFGRPLSIIPVWRTLFFLAVIMRLSRHAIRVPKHLDLFVLPVLFLPWVVVFPFMCAFGYDGPAYFGIAAQCFLNFTGLILVFHLYSLMSYNHQGMSLTPPPWKSPAFRMTRRILRLLGAYLCCCTLVLLFDNIYWTFYAIPNNVPLKHSAIVVMLLCLVRVITLSAVWVLLPIDTSHGRLSDMRTNMSASTRVCMMSRGGSQIVLPTMVSSIQVVEARGSTQACATTVKIPVSMMRTRILNNEKKPGEAEANPIVDGNLVLGQLEVHEAESSISLRKFGGEGDASGPATPAPGKEWSEGKDEPTDLDWKV